MNSSIFFKKIELLKPTNETKHFLHQLKVIPQYCIAHPYCARFSRRQRAQMSPCTNTTKEISLKLSSIEKVTYVSYCIIIVYIFSTLIKKKITKQKNYRKEKKDIGERVHKTVTLRCKLLRRKWGLYECFTSTSFQIVWCFHKFYMILFYMLDTVLVKFFPKSTLINYVSSYRKI